MFPKNAHSQLASLIFTYRAAARSSLRSLSTPLDVPLKVLCPFFRTKFFPDNVCLTEVWVVVVHGTFAFLMHGIFIRLF